MTFREVQRLGLWLRCVAVSSMAVAVAVDCFVLREKIFPSREILPIILLTFFGVLLPIAIAILFLMLKLETEVRSDALYVRLFPVHVRYKRFTAEDLAECYARQYKPVLEYGGWGIRFDFKGGKAYNVSGKEGVQLVLRNGKRLLIGTQRPDELAEAISSVMGSN